jgi:cell division protein YceG involved in septum cleavage
MRKHLPFIILASILLSVCLFLTFVTIPSQAARIYGQPASWLTISQRVQYSAQLLWYDGLLTRPRDVNGAELSFTIQPGESVTSVANNLEAVGFIHDAEALRAYLIYSGLDTSIQAGEFKFRH